MMAFFKDFRNYLCLFSIFGLWTYWQKSKCTCLFRWNSAYQVFSEISVVSYVLTVTYKAFVNSSLSQNVANWLYVIITLTHMVIASESFIKRKYEALLIEKFDAVDRLFDVKLKIQIPYKRQRRQLFWRFFIVLASIFYLKGALSAFLHYHNEMFISWYPALYSIWIMTLRSIQVVFFVFLVRSRLQLIDSELEKLQTPQDVEMEFGEFGQSEFLRIFVYRRIKNLKQIYAELFEICTLINATFGWSLLAVFVQCFVDFTFNSYWSFLYLDDAELEFVSLIICVSLLLPLVLLSSILSFYCNSCFQRVSFHSLELQNFSFFFVQIDFYFFH